MSSLLAGNTDVMKDFYDSLKEKIKEAVSDTMPDAVLNEMAKKVIEEEFFDRGKAQTDSFGHATGPPELTRFEKAVVEVLRPRIESLMEEIANEHVWPRVALLAKKQLEPERLNAMMTICMMTRLTTLIEIQTSAIEQLREEMQQAKYR